MASQCLVLLWRFRENKSSNLSLKQQYQLVQFDTNHVFVFKFSRGFFTTSGSVRGVASSYSAKNANVSNINRFCLKVDASYHTLCMRYLTPTNRFQCC